MPCRFPAVMMLNQTIGRPMSGMNTWTFGRAFVDNKTSTWKAVFPAGALEWNASRLASPPSFFVLGNNPTITDHQGAASYQVQQNCLGMQILACAFHQRKFALKGRAVINIGPLIFQSVIHGIHKQLSKKAGCQNALGDMHPRRPRGALFRAFSRVLAGTQFFFLPGGHAHSYSEISCIRSQLAKNP